MHIHIISCEVLKEELELLLPVCKNRVTVSYLKQGLHDTPKELNRQLSSALLAMNEQPDYIVLGYGLCSNGTVGIRAQKVPVVVPRTDDCIALFLGSMERYLKLFHEKSGTYWLNSGWIKTAFLPTKENLEKKREEFRIQFGEDNADFLMENEMAWAKNYTFCGYIKSVTDSEDNLILADQMAQYNGLELFFVDSDNRMLKKLTDGDWNQDEFLICPPYHEICASFDEKKFISLPYSNIEK